MVEIDTSRWKVFTVGELFETHAVGEKTHVPTGGAVARKLLSDGSTPRITVSGVDNGVVGYFEDVDTPNYRTYENFISVSFLGTVFYQEQRTSVDMKVHVLTRNDLNTSRGLFLVAAIRAGLANCSYANQITSALLPKLMLMLPATSNGEPDWMYMERYMCNVMQREEMFAKHFAALMTDGSEGHVIDTSGWREFRVGELFNVKRGTSRVMRNLCEGSTPLIAAARADQGVAGLFDVPVEYHDAITVSCNGAGCGSTFYHDGGFAVTGDAAVLIAKESLAGETQMFVASTLDNRLTATYSYAEKCGPVSLTEETIMLPATSDGEPDWDYMESYMRSVLERESIYADELAQVLAGDAQ